MADRGMEKTAANALLRAGCDPAPPGAAGRLALFLREVEYWSGKIHLVGKGSLGKSIENLLVDSLALLKTAETSGIVAEKVADIGSGAGFPGLVWKIVRPEILMTLFERRLKPQSFLGRTVARLGLVGITVIGEDAGHAGAEGAFDLLTSKAAGRLAGLLPLAERLLVPGGAYITIKGGAWEREVPRRARSAMRLETSVELPEGRGTALIFRKGTDA
jgi:16S rRNA (guanine527-N7)-methyltransferase